MAWPKPARTRFAQRKNYTMVARPASKFTSHAIARAIYVAARLLKIALMIMSLSSWALTDRNIRSLIKRPGHLAANAAGAAIQNT
jgi:hypothetical protein